MEQYKEIVSNLQADAIKVVQHLSRLLMNKSTAETVIANDVEEYLCDLENLCIKSRNMLDKYGWKRTIGNRFSVDKKSINVAGEMEVTHEGWIKITLNSLLPNCRHRISGYIGDTISRLLENYEGELPYFETAFMAIVEYCNNENHNALDNDNKGWKMIPNALKGRVIEDDNQFILSVGLFTKTSEEPKCEVYILPLDEGNLFMDLLVNDML